ncbi:molecular chaperone DnaJ [Phocaeicola plebeius]|jgi:DnaJ-class molecular chaperone|uniref:molecular chaperone DnaJ n=1 Tax=Phocaeicola plebeius TaxID=310297 RepID=UPI0026F0E0A7|nr:molecular chaperone DnaJ [Phocaeicola plebeius]
MKTEKTYIHRRVCLCRQCGGTGTVTVYAEKDVRREYPQQKVCPQCQGSGRIWLSGTVIKQIEPYAEPEP